MVSPSPAGFGQLHITYDGATPVVHGPMRDGSEQKVDSCGETLRAWLREDDFGRYRPLSSATTMRPGWYVRCEGGLSLEEALDVIYPLARQHSAMHAAGTLRVVTLQEVFDRQSGRYGAAGTLPQTARQVAREVLCDLCVKEPLWGGPVPVGAIPCPEPCSVMLSLCREAALWEDDPPSVAATDRRLSWAAFDAPGNEIREAYLAARFSTADEVGLSQ